VGLRASLGAAFCEEQVRILYLISNSVLVELAVTESLKQQNIEAKKNAWSDLRK
jgi:hypothetical protein